MKSKSIDKTVLQKAFSLLCTAKSITETFEEQFKLVSKYVHATSRGHEAIQIAVGMQLTPKDYVAPYYRDDAMLLSIGMQPYDLMLQVLAKRDDPFSGGRSYYCHPSLKDNDKPKIPHQSSATGMQAIPTTGVAMGIQYREKVGLEQEDGAVVVCSFGDAAITEGEGAEAFQMAALKQFPILYLVQDNGWDISATAEEIRAMNAFEYAKGFPGIEAVTIDGTDFNECYETITKIFNTIRTERRPFLLHARVPLLNHHTSGVRKEWYRHDLEEHKKEDPYFKLKDLLLKSGFTEGELSGIETEAEKRVESDLERALLSPDPMPSDLFTHDFEPTLVLTESGNRSPSDAEEKVMVDCALIAVQELMEDHKECLLYGQDVGGRLGGVFREAATLAQKFGDDRVFNTPIQEAFIVGSTVGMEGQGPEHSSARMERFLQNCANFNMIIANVTTPANFFHMIRRQLAMPYRKPLVLMSPKSLLRHPECVSNIEEFSGKTKFKEIIPDSLVKKAKRVLFCSGKLYYELNEYRTVNKINDIAIIRVEQLYPLPEAEIRNIMKQYGKAEFFWVQEESANMGAWSYLMTYFRKDPLELISRKASASPATGFKKVHDQQQEELIKTAFGVK